MLINFLLNFLNNIFERTFDKKYLEDEFRTKRMVEYLFSR